MTLRPTATTIRPADTPFDPERTVVPSTTPDDLRGPVTAPQRIGRYLLSTTIGIGGMGTVALAKLAGDGGFSRPVAVKRLLPDDEGDASLGAALLAEARIASLVRHPNVVPVLDVVDDGGLLVVMEYVFGDSLAGLLSAARARGEAPPLAVSVAIAIGMLEGLHAAHEATDANGVPMSIVHRDVSPQNVLVGADGVARITDFGIAKARGSSVVTEAGVAKGKFLYMAPEQISGGALDRRTDVWAAGLVLWEMLVGRPMFADPSAMYRFHAGLERVAPPSEVAVVAHELDAVVMRALAPSPSDRFPTARAMAVALERATSPATARDVGSWVRRLAREKLEAREADLRDLDALEIPAVAPPEERASTARERISAPFAGAPPAPAAQPRSVAARRDALATGLLVAMAALVLVFAVLRTTRRAMRGSVGPTAASVVSTAAAPRPEPGAPIVLRVGEAPEPPRGEPMASSATVAASAPAPASSGVAEEGDRRPPRRPKRTKPARAAAGRTNIDMDTRK